MQKNINIPVQFKYWYDYSIVTTEKKMTHEIHVFLVDMS